MSAANFYAKAVSNAFKGNIKVGTNTIKAGLLTHSYSPSLASNEKWSDISSNEASGTNYTSGGATVTSPTLTVTAAASWATSRANSTAYSVGQVVIPSSSNGYLYRCEAAGTSGSSAPTYPTVFGGTVSDGTVTWTNIGSALVQLTADASTWSNLTCSDFRYIVYYDSTSGYLIACHDTGSTQNVSATNVTYTPDATGVGYIFVA